MAGRERRWMEGPRATTVRGRRLQVEARAVERYRMRCARALGVVVARIVGPVAVARCVGLAPSTVSMWAARFEASPSGRALVEAIAERMAGALEETAFELIAKGRELIPQAETAAECFRSLGTVIDRALVLRGHASAITEVRAQLTPQQQEARLAEIMERARLRLESGEVIEAEVVTEPADT